ncbi:Hypothetical protein Minf_0220 [Methylacidiphilum infernorum V4]|uniref:Uncharacterized protein n=1 Tax=Methylacidiphilum infernorum (isolate V4) TaxID=481448 RepID=B3DXP6_METI4|nr:Hypothetical protein Minf_0220 [Methylacidiphilum infernorum V4]
MVISSFGRRDFYMKMFIIHGVFPFCCLKKE